MLKPLYKRAKIEVGLAPKSLASTNAIGAYYGMQMYRKALAVLNVGAMEAGNTAKIEVFKAKDASGNGAELITGATATITAAGALQSAKAFVEVDVSSLDANNGFEYIAVKVTTNATLVVAATLLLGDARFEPVQDANAYASV